MSEGEETIEIMLQQFLSVFRITPNPNTVSEMSLVELMFTSKFKYVLMNYYLIFFLLCT